VDDTEHLEDGWRTLAADAARLAKDAGALKRTAVALSGPQGYESLKKVQRDLDKLETLEAVPAELLERASVAAAPVREWLGQEWGRRAARFASEVREHFEERAVSVEGEPPRLVAKPLELRIEAAQDRVDLYYAGEPLKTGVPMAPERVFREREAALQRLQRQGTRPDVMAERLIEAYDVLNGRAGGKPGDRVRLSDLHFQLFVARQSALSRTTLTKGRIKDYARAQFAWDLAALLDVPHFRERDGRRLKLRAPKPSAVGSRTGSITVVRGDGAVEAYGVLRVV